MSLVSAWKSPILAAVETWLHAFHNQHLCEPLLLHSMVVALPWHAHTTYSGIQNATHMVKRSGGTEHRPASLGGSTSGLGRHPGRHDSIELRRSLWPGSRLVVRAWPAGAGRAVMLADALTAVCTQVLAGSVVAQGETEALVAATGGATFFGQTVALLSEPEEVGHLRKVRPSSPFFSYFFPLLQWCPL